MMIKKSKEKAAPEKVLYAFELMNEDPRGDFSRKYEYREIRRLMEEVMGEKMDVSGRY